MSVGLDIALTSAQSSLMARQKELAIISNNAAKMNETGYHRQRAELESNAVVLGRAAYFGTGVHVSTITRYYDKALENSLKQSYGNNSYNQTYANNLENVEDLVGPNGANPLNDAVYEFAGNLQELGSFPESSANRTALLSSAGTMADKFNQSYSNLVSIRDNLAHVTTGEGAIKDRVTELNDLVSQIPQLNDQIKELEQNAFLDQKANDLRDERNAIVKKISKLVNVTVTEASDFRISITVGGHTLVDGTALPNTTVNTINYSMTANAPHGTPTLTWSDDGSDAITNLSTGEIKASLDSRDYVTSKMDELYDFAALVTSTVNTQHNLGFDLDGNAGTDILATPGVQPASGTIMSVIQNDPRKVAASAVAGAEGDGDNARAIWAELNAGQASLNQSSILTYSDRYLGKIAEDVSAAKSKANTSQATETMFENAIHEYSSVNLDQEMSHMLEVQKAYQASAKMITVVDQMLQTVINLR